MSEPFTVERLREMMEGATPEVRESSTVLWAADEIDRLRALLAAHQDDRRWVHAVDRILNSRYMEPDAIEALWAYMDEEITDEEYDRRLS